MEIEKIDRIIEMAWEDRTPFEAIKSQFGFDESEVIKLMRNNLKKSSFKLWRKRVNGRTTKHLKLRRTEKYFCVFKCSRQKNISNNKFSNLFILHQLQSIGLYFHIPINLFDAIYCTSSFVERQRLTRHLL